MSRADRRTGRMTAVALLVIALGVTLGGCLRIYPDPELPDIRVEWFTGATECADGSDRVVASLIAMDAAGPPEVGAITVPCVEGFAVFADVARVRYTVTLRLEAENGDVFGGYTEQLDLRDGFSERVVAFFGRAPEPNLRVAWTFDMGASCASLGATQVALQLTLEGGATYFLFAPCDVPVLVQTVPEPGTYTLVISAITDGGAGVATSAPTAPFTIERGEITDLGTITLTP